MQVLENSIEIGRGAAEVFDYCSDMRTEAEWNPAVRGVALETPEPVGAGSRFTLRTRGFGDLSMEVTRFAPASSWTARSTGAALPVTLTGTVEATGAGSSRLTMRIELTPEGVRKPLGPVVARFMRRTARENVRRIKEAVERRPIP